MAKDVVRSKLMVFIGYSIAFLIIIVWIPYGIYINMVDTIDGFDNNSFPQSLWCDQEGDGGYGDGDSGGDDDYDDDIDFECDEGCLWRKTYQNRKTTQKRNFGTHLKTHFLLHRTLQTIYTTRAIGL